jgi:hypothetical protein
MAARVLLSATFLNVKSRQPALDLEDAEVAEFAYTPG